MINPYLGKLIEIGFQHAPQKVLQEALDLKARLEAASPELDEGLEKLAEEEEGGGRDGV